MADDEVVLVTGYPSLLARSVSVELLRSDERCRVLALTRPSAADAAASSVAELPHDQRERIELIEGSAGAIDFGLSGAEFKALAHEVTTVHHCAQVTSLGVERKMAERVNVGGSQEAIEFARSCKNLECLVFHSTAMVSGDRTGIVREDELNAGQSFRNVVEETKARAEKVMRAAMGSLPVAVLRPATIVGDSVTGAVDRFHGPYLLVLLVVTSPPDFALPLPGRGDEPLNMVPIDWVARSAVAIGRDTRARGRTFHLVDPHPLPARRVLELMARAAGRRGPRVSIPANLAKAVLRAPGLDRIAKTPRAFLETLTTPVSYDARNADELLASLGLPGCPPLETYVDRLVEYVQERLRRGRTSRPPPEIEEPLA
jgi:nucleoside-diphosphate-sugar epimerase